MSTDNQLNSVPIQSAVIRRYALNRSVRVVGTYLDPGRSVVGINSVMAFEKFTQPDRTNQENPVLCAIICIGGMRETARLARDLLFIWFWSRTLRQRLFSNLFAHEVTVP
jgi:hypothetical protein